MKNIAKKAPAKTPAAKKVATKRSKTQKPQTVYELLKPFIGIIKDAPADLSENHKEYASGRKKWR